MTVLRLNLFGAFEAKTTDTGADSISFRSDKIRALLAYLAVESGRPHRRESLAALLWPEYSDSDALHNLRNSLYRLRHSFDAKLSDKLLTLDRQNAYLHAESLELDVAHFKALLDECAGHQHQARKHCAACIERLQKTAGLYQGEFLTGFSLPDALPFEEWLLVYRERFHQQALAALYDLSTFYRQQGQFGLARKYAARQVALEPWREAGHRQMMQALALSGRLDDALAQFENCRRILEKELGTEPSPETVSLYEQIRDGRSANRPLLASAEAQEGAPLQPSYHLPRQFTHFVGRQVEINYIIEQLADPACALLTIVGPGGMGKTRLAIEAARQQLGSYEHGVWFVSLAPIQAFNDIPAAVAAALPLPPFGSADIERQVLNYLSDKQVLLVIDNFEHLLGGAAFLLTLLERAPQVNILVTSRERLNSRAEWVFEIQGLTAPSELAVDSAADSYPAVQLFIQNLQQVRRSLVLKEQDVKQIGRICTLVEGVPLAIELATNLAATRSFSEIAELITNDLNTLKTRSRDVPERQRSLRAVFDHSWELLNEGERKALRSIAVFPASFTLEAAVEVTGTTEQYLRSLTEKSFLRRSENGRFEMHVLLRQFANEKLHETASVRVIELLHERFNAYYLTFLQKYETVLDKPGSRSAVLEIRQEIDNIRPAWQSIVAQPDIPEIARSFQVLVDYFSLSGQSREGERLLQAAIKAVGRVIPKKTENLSAAEKEKHSLMSRLLTQRVRFLIKLAMVEEGLPAAKSAIEHGKLAGDIDGWLDAQHHFVMFLWRQGRYKTALEQSEISIELSKQANTALFKIRALSQHGSIHFFLGDFVQARQYYEQAIYRFKEAGIEGLSLIAVYTNLGSLSTVEGNYAESRKYLEQALDMYRQIGSFFGEGMIIGYLSILAFHEQRYIVALTLAQKALDAMRELNEVVRQAGALMVLGNVYTRLGQWETGRSHYKQALALSRPVDNQKTEIEALINLSLLSCRLGDFQEALALNKQAIQLTAESGDRHLHAYALTGQGRALEGMGQIEEALDSYLAALALRRQMNQLNLIAELQALIAHLYWNQGDLKQAVAYIEDVLAHLGFPGRPNNEKPIPIPPNSQTRPPSIQQLNGAQEPFRLYLTCHQILEATNDERIDGVRDFAIRQLEEQTQQIDDPHLRQSFLENVPVHRQLLSFSKTPH